MKRFLLRLKWLPMALFTAVQKPRDEAFWATPKNGLWCLFLSGFSRQIGLCSA